MSSDEAVMAAIAAALRGRRGISTRKMFGGLCYLLHGNMLCGVTKGRMVARVGKDAYPRALKRAHARPMDFTGRELRGMVFIDPPGLKTKAAIKSWVELSLDFVRTLPPKR